MKFIDFLFFDGRWEFVKKCGDKMAAGILFINCENSSAIGNTVEGYDVGVDIINCKNMTTSDNDFVNVRTAIRADGIDGLEARRNTQRNSTKFAPYNLREMKVKERRSEVYEGRFSNILSADALEFCIKKLRNISNGNDRN